MSNLWLACIGLLIMAMGFLIWPLLKKRDVNIGTEEVDVKQNNVLIFRERLAELEHEKQQGRLDDKSYSALKIELEKSLLQDVSGQTVIHYQHQPATISQVVIIFSSALLLILVSVGIYAQLGASDKLATYLNLKEQGLTAQQPQGKQTKKAPDFEQAIVMLKQRIADNPEDIDKYSLLANSYAALGRYTEMAGVYIDLAKQVGENHKDYAAIKGWYAQALFQSVEETFTPAVEAAMAEALALDKDESTVLILSGLQAYTQDNYAVAIQFWQQAKVKALPEQVNRFINPAINEASKKLGLPIEKVAISNAKIIINLSLAAEFKASVKDNDVIFVFARGVGGRMPLAAERLQVKDLPKQIILDDTKAAMPTAVLSSVEKVDIVARISKSGTPRAQKGDLFIEQLAVEVNKARELNLVINQRQP